ncbi:hypothetical protein BH09VER1_BH09VER1_52890 [soil metagenome]
MCEKSPRLSDLIAAEIVAQGPISFARFMALALYHPQLGYYASGRAKIAQAGGDFFTNVSVGPVFGRILAGQFCEMWERLERPTRFCLVEQGANDGQLAADVLAALSAEMLPTLEYWIVEGSESLRRQQEQRLAPFAGKVRWARDLAELPPFVGVHFSNELIDALPFHLIRSTGEVWDELKVAREGDDFVFVGEAPPVALAGEIATLPQRASGYVTEVRPAAREWIAALGARLQAGYVLVVDYGFTREELLSLERTEGTFSCYRAHHRDAKPLEEVGEKDITAHVDFTALGEAALEAGFRVDGWADQHHFMVGASESLLRRLEGPPTAETQKLLRTLKTLLHPESMGTQFHYLALSKGLGEHTALPGFRYGRPAADLFAPVMEWPAEEGSSPRG